MGLAGQPTTSGGRFPPIGCDDGTNTSVHGPRNREVTAFLELCPRVTHLGR